MVTEIAWMQVRTSDMNIEIKLFLSTYSLLITLHGSKINIILDALFRVSLLSKRYIILHISSIMHDAHQDLRTRKRTDQA